MKKLSLLLLMMTVLAFTSMAQALPRPMNSSISEWLDGVNYDERDGTYKTSAMIHLDYGTDIMGNPVADDYPGFWGDEAITDELTYTLLDPEKVFYRIYTDNDIPFVFTSDVYPALFADVYPGMHDATLIPFGYDGGDIEYWGPHFPGLTNHVEELAEYGIVVNPFFTWRIGVQMVYVDNGQTSTSDIVYMEIFPQLKPATQVTSTSFLADWSCDYENTYVINNFYDDGLPGYYLYVINKATQDTIAINNIEAPNYVEDDFGNPEYLAGATYLVEGLEPGATYEYYVVVRQNPSAGGVYRSVVREVTLPMPYTAPVMLPADEEYISSTEFLAEWTDASDPDWVQDYTLYVTSGSGLETLLTEAFSGVTVENDGTARIENNLDTYCDNAGWTGSYVYQAGGGGLKFGNSSNGGGLTTPVLDLSNSGGTVTVTFNAKNYGSDATTVTVSCGNVSQTVTLTGEAEEYTITLEGVTAAEGQQISIMSTGRQQRWYVYDVNIAAGGAGENYVFTGITDTSYIVEGLTPGETYSYYVVANYTDDNSLTSNIEQVTLPLPPVPELIAEPDALTMTANVGGTVTATIEVLGANLTNDVTVTLADESGMFSVAPATITIAEAEEGATVTVTYAPTAKGEHTATVTIASQGAEPVIVTIAGNALMNTTAPVMLPADEELVESTAFIAEWTDETPAGFVVDYTLHVTSGDAAPVSVLTEAFGGVNVENDGTARIENDLDTYCDNAGWTGSYVYQAGGGGLKFGNSSNGGGLTTPALDLSNSGGTVTVTFNAKNYGSDATTVTVSCGNVSQTVELTGEATEYTVTLEGVTAAEGQQISIMSTGRQQRWYVYDVNISMLAANELVFNEITETMYLVEGLTPGATYSYYVVANYIDGTSAASNVEEVTLPEAQEHFKPGDVNHDKVVDVNDVTMLIAFILGSDVDICTICANVVEDTEIDVADVTAIIGLILTSE